MHSAKGTSSSIKPEPGKRSVKVRLGSSLSASLKMLLIRAANSMRPNAPEEAAHLTRQL